MQVKVVLVGPEYQQNIGYCARVMANFGFYEMAIVNPAVKIGKDAVKYSKHGIGVLKGAKVFKSLGAAVRDCPFVVGTTAITSGGRDVLRTSITPGQLPKLGKTKVALLLGREGTGLSKDELGECDVVVRIRTSPEYPTLNISHALAIMLYELSKTNSKRTEGEYLGKNEKEIIIKNFERLAKRVSLRSPRTVSLAFRRILSRGVRSEIEGRALLQVLKNL